MPEIIEIMKSYPGWVLATVVIVYYIKVRFDRLENREGVNQIRRREKVEHLEGRVRELEMRSLPPASGSSVAVPTSTDPKVRSGCGSP